DSVTFPGFGSFEPRKRIERIAFHPSSGKRMLIPPKITMTFRPSSLLKQKVRNHE
ncbi:MAG: HU family DNA-binding protein, partial [Muribaculaceae bacterium]|nr:HU family DNA-binding protein [Muribaculaceae bacterium]